MAAAAATRNTTATGTPAKAAKKTTRATAAKVPRAPRKTAGPLPKPATREELVNDDTPWDMVMIAENLGVKHQTVKSWRKDYRKAIKNQQAPHPKLLPEPDGPKVPGKPMWKAGTVRAWAMQTDRMLEDGTAVKQKPPGRPPRS